MVSIPKGHDSPSGPICTVWLDFVHQCICRWCHSWRRKGSDQCLVSCTGFRVTRGLLEMTVDGTPSQQHFISATIFKMTAGKIWPDYGNKMLFLWLIILASWHTELSKGDVWSCEENTNRSFVFWSDFVRAFLRKWLQKKTISFFLFWFHENDTTEKASY